MIDVLLPDQKKIPNIFVCLFTSRRLSETHQIEICDKRRGETVRTWLTKAYCEGRFMHAEIYISALHTLNSIEQQYALPTQFCQ